MKLKDEILQADSGALEELRDWIANRGGQLRFATKVMMHKDLLNKKLNGKSPIYLSDWKRWSLALTGVEHKIEDVAFPERFPQKYKAIFYATYFTTGAQLNYYECMYFEKKMNDRFCETKEMEK